MSLPEHIKKALEFNNIKYEMWEHEPVSTSEAASKLRNVPLHAGVKAMVLYDEQKDKAVAALLPGNYKIDLPKLRSLTDLKKLKLASPERSKSISGIEIGGICPFGFIKNIDVYIDKKVFDNEHIYCSASKEISLKLNSKDLLVLNPNAVVEEFTEKKN